MTLLLRQRYLVNFVTCEFGEDRMIQGEEFGEDAIRLSVIKKKRTDGVDLVLKK